MGIVREMGVRFIEDACGLVTYVLLALRCIGHYCQAHLKRTC
jgi:hypothetical protein